MSNLVMLMHILYAAFDKGDPSVEEEDSTLQRKGANKLDHS